MARLRLEADLIFDDGDPAAADAYDVLVALAPKLGTIPAARGIAPSRVRLHRCRHDEVEGAPCEPISSWRVV